MPRSDLLFAETDEKVGTAAEFIPARPTLKSLREAAAGCTACPLYKLGTQTVFGEGSARAPLMLVGEQPGDYEDRAGRPFVGPAGQLLDRALGEAGIDRSQAYVTNAVKHFKWTPRGKRRIHSKPSGPEIAACHPWLQAELELVAPEVLVCLGATAAQALLGRDFRVTKQRGTLIKSNLAPNVLATVHPSSLLRLPPQADPEAEFRRFVADLKVAAKALRH
ncbi:MAG TPA: UdgX family uracil-DNA binding protein [Alphaproteobacteria bacterium]|nr:UdgX family uracil-DNA binding protein [Alphaproteobacteria bacterium]